MWFRRRKAEVGKDHRCGCGRPLVLRHYRRPKDERLSAAVVCWACDLLGVWQHHGQAGARQ